MYLLPHEQSVSHCENTHHLSTPAAPCSGLGLHFSVRVIEPPALCTAPENTNLKFGAFHLFLEHVNPTIQDHLAQPVQSMIKP